MKENKNMELKEFEYFPWNTKKDQRTSIEYVKSECQFIKK